LVVGVCVVFFHCVSSISVLCAPSYSIYPNIVY